MRPFWTQSNWRLKASAPKERSPKGLLRPKMACPSPGRRGSAKGLPKKPQKSGKKPPQNRRSQSLRARSTGVFTHVLTTRLGKPMHICGPLNARGKPRQQAERQSRSARDRVLKTVALRRLGACGFSRAVGTSGHQSCCWDFRTHSHDFGGFSHAVGQASVMLLGL